MITSVPENSGSRNAGSPRSFPPRRPGVGSSEGQRHALYIFSSVFSSVRRHLPVFLIVSFGLVGCGAFVFRNKGKPVYSSQSVVYISPRFPKVLNPDSEVELPYDSYFQDEILTVTRYDIVADAISQLSAEVRHRTGPPLPSEIVKLQHSLVMTRIGTSYEMSIALLGSSPDGLADIVNAVTNSYLERTRNEEFYGLRDRLNTLRQESGHLREQIDSGLAEQADLMQQLGVASLPTGEGVANPYDTSSNSVRNQLNLARMQREAAEAQLDASLKGDGRGEASALDTAGEEAIAADPGLSGMRSTLNNRRGLLLEEMSGLRPDHPIHQKDQDELSSIDGVMRDLRKKAAAQLQSKLRGDVERTRLVELKLTQELNESTQNAAAAAPKFQRAIELGPEIESLQKAYEAVDDRIRALELESSSPGSVHLSTKALTPVSPEHSRFPLYVLALLLVSFGCASAVATGIDFFDSRIYMAEDIERVLGFQPIGILLDTDEFSEETAEDYYFRLAAGIDNAVRNAGARIFLFTSQAHGAGTSTIIRKLSEELRDLNLRCRTIRAAGSGGTDGSRRGAFSRSELLLQGWNDNDEVQQAPLAKGAASSRPGPWMKEDAAPADSAEEALQYASVGYDVVLIDSDPLPISANTEYLARVVDATVLVIKAGTTTRQQLHRAARLLERLQVAGVAVVLNKIRLERADRDLRRELRSFERGRPNDVEEAHPRERSAPLESVPVARTAPEPEVVEVVQPHAVHAATSQVEVPDFAQVAASPAAANPAPGSVVAPVVATDTRVKDVPKKPLAVIPSIDQTPAQPANSRASFLFEQAERDGFSLHKLMRGLLRSSFGLPIVMVAAALVAVGLAGGVFMAWHPKAAVVTVPTPVASTSNPVESRTASLRPAAADTAALTAHPSARVSSPVVSGSLPPSAAVEQASLRTKVAVSKLTQPHLKSSRLPISSEPPSIVVSQTGDLDFGKTLPDISAPGSPVRGAVAGGHLQ
jgi:succinoglycan biosynthesis transport protein ExoP